MAIRERQDRTCRNRKLLLRLDGVAHLEVAKVSSWRRRFLGFSKMGSLQPSFSPISAITGTHGLSLQNLS